MLSKGMLRTSQLLAARTRMNTLTRMRLPASTAGLRKFSTNDNFMSGTNANYIDYMYAQWQKDPSSVHSSWNAYFAAEEGGASISYQSPPTLGKSSGSGASNDQLG